MKNLFYFSKHKLKFIEITNFQKKFTFMVVFVSFILTFFVFGTYILINDVINPDSKLESLKSENKELIKNINYLLSQYKKVGENLDSLAKTNTELRLAANLSNNSDEYSEIGSGGKLFDDYLANNSSDVNRLIGTLNSYVDQLKVKISFEKSNFKEIQKTLSSNKLLYAALPAIRPTTEGTYSDDFGMRMHPVLHFMRMHNGMDILTDIGTKVYSTGAGVVEFCGYREGYGLTCEINNGFGYRTLFGHLSEIEVKEGQKVNRGDFVALSGNSGNLTSGPHVHYEVRHDGIALNPLNFMFDNITVFDLKKEKIE